MSVACRASLQRPDQRDNEQRESHRYANGTQPAPTIAAAKPIAKLSSIRLATGHRRKNASARSIASPQGRTARIATSPATMTSPAGTRGRRSSQRDNPSASAPPISTGQKAAQSVRGVRTWNELPLPTSGNSVQGTATAITAMISQGQV